MRDYTANARDSLTDDIMRGSSRHASFDDVLITADALVSVLNVGSWDDFIAKRDELRGKVAEYVNRELAAEVMDRADADREADADERRDSRRAA